MRRLVTGKQMKEIDAYAIQTCHDCDNQKRDTVYLKRPVF